MRTIAILVASLLAACGGPVSSPAQPTTAVLACEPGGEAIHELLGSSGWCGRGGPAPTHSGATETPVSRYELLPDGTYRVDTGSEIDPGGLVSREVTYRGGLSARGCWRVVDGRAALRNERASAWIPIEVTGPGRIRIGTDEDLRGC